MTKLSNFPYTKTFIRILYKFAELFFIIASFMIILYTIIQIIYSFNQGFENIIKILVENAFLLIALVEIFKGFIDFERYNLTSSPL